MTPEELQAILGRIGNPDTAPEAIVELNTKVTAMIEAANTAADAIREKDTRISELQATALKLAMTQTQPQPTPAPEKTPEEEEAEFNKTMREEFLKGYAY